MRQLRLARLIAFGGRVVVVEGGAVAAVDVLAVDVAAASEIGLG